MGSFPQTGDTTLFNGKENGSAVKEPGHGQRSAPDRRPLPRRCRPSALDPKGMIFSMAGAMPRHSIGTDAIALKIPYSNIDIHCGP